MAKQSINVGTTANDKKGDSLRAAFQKVNANFTELYTALGLNSDGTLNLGAFEFTGSTLSTTDSTAIVIDQATTVTSNLTVGGDLIPQIANGGDLGSLARPWKSLYVSNSTVYLGGVPLSLEAGTNELRVNNVPISQNITYTDIPNAPVDISDLTDADGLLSSGTGDITFAATTISAPNDDDIRIEAKDENGDVRAYFKVDPADGQAEMRALSSTAPTYWSLTGGDWESAQWIADGGGGGYIEFTNAPDFISYLNDAPSDQYIRINGGAPVRKGSGGSSEGNNISVPTSGFPSSTTIVNTVEFFSIFESRIEIDYDSDIDIYGDQLDISIQSTDNVSVLGSDVRIDAITTLGLTNYASDQPIEIITDGDDSRQTWTFGADGDLKLPADGDILRYDGEGYSSVLGGTDTGDWAFSGNAAYNGTDYDQGLYIAPGGEGVSYVFVPGNSESATVPIQISNGSETGQVSITADNKQWQFDANGDLTLPSGGTIAETVITDNPTIVITPAEADSPHQALYIKGGLPLEDPVDYHLHLTTGDLTDTSIILGTDNHNVRTTVDGNIQITTPTEGSNVWEFDTTGALTFPDDTVQTTAWTGILPNPTYSGSDQIGFATPAPLNLNNSAEATLLTQLNLINTGGGEGSGSAIDYWTYTSINDVPQVRLQAVDNGDYSADFAIRIKANGNEGLSSLTTTWTFGTDGDLTLPGNIQASSDLSITVPSGIPTSISNLVAPDGGWNTPPYTNLATTGGTGTGLTVNVSAADGGYININYITINTPGTGYTNGDVITINNENNLPATFTINVPAPSWEFGADGDITLPAGGDVVDSTSVSQLAKRVEGSWSVTSGTNTYSFTVPADGTYTMWVKGNIANGIITWNATASVSNTNVPTIGFQYAWNYTGGGSPILLTSIPDQIKGVAGTISTDNTYVGTTSNRFDFGISNTSGASQTVYYGYTRI